MTSIAQSALEYASRGWPVFPLHAPMGEGCSCGDPGCEHIGKHPRTKHGFLDGTTDETIIRQWWTQWPDANVGIATGGVSGLVGIDIDPRHGGEESVAGLERQHGSLPGTVQSLTGGGGRHLFFAHPGGHVKSRTLVPGIDVKADGGYIVTPPSVHASGRQYEWEVSSHPDDTPVAPLPDWLRAMVTSPPSASGQPSADAPGPFRDGERNTALTSLAGTMRRAGMGEAEIRAALLEVNRRRCQPQLPVQEVGRIASSVSRYAPGPAPLAKRPEAGVEAADHTSAPAEAVVTGDSPIANPWPEALSPEALHGLAGDFVRAIEPHTEADSAALLLSSFVAFGNVVGRGPHFVADAAAHYTNLYAILVGRTSKGRKGSAHAQVIRPFKVVDPDWALDRVQFGLSSGEGLIWAVRDAIERQQPVKKGGRVVDYESVVEDPGITDKRLFITEMEFAMTLRVMGRDGNTLSAVVRGAWDTGDLRVLTKNSPAKATGAHVSIIGHISRDEVLRHLDTTEAGNGFANRFLWVCVKRSKLLPEGGQIHQVDFAPLTRRLTAAVKFARDVGEMKRDDEARGLWYDVYPKLSQELPGLLGAVVARAEAQTMRLACIYALLDQSAMVRREHLEAALAVWKYCDASVRFIFGDALGDSVADEILRVLRQREDGLTRTEISKHFGRNRAATDISRALGRLHESGLAVCVPDAPAGGRPAERWLAVTPGRWANSQSTKETNETK